MPPALDSSRSPLTPGEVKELLRLFDDTIEGLKKVVETQQFLLFKVEERRRILKEVIAPPSPQVSPKPSPIAQSHNITTATLSPLQASNFLKQMSDRLTEYESKSSLQVPDQKSSRTEGQTQKKVIINTEDLVTEKKSDMIHLVSNQLIADKSSQPQQHVHQAVSPQQSPHLMHQHQHQSQYQQQQQQSHQHQHMHHQLFHQFQQQIPQQQQTQQQQPQPQPQQQVHQQKPPTQQPQQQQVQQQKPQSQTPVQQQTHHHHHFAPYQQPQQQQRPPQQAYQAQQQSYQQQRQQYQANQQQPQDQTQQQMDKLFTMTQLFRS